MLSSWLEASKLQKPRLISAQTKFGPHAEDELLTAVIPSLGASVGAGSQLSLTRVSNTNNAAGNSAAGIADRLTRIIDFGMDDNGVADNRVFGAENGNIIKGNFIVGFAVIIGLDIAEVTGVPVFCGWQCMLMAFRVIVAAGAHAVHGRAVAVLVDMKGVLLAGVKAFKVGHDFH